MLTRAPHLLVTSLDKSTIVRTFPKSLAPFPIRGLLRALDALAPSLAASLVERKFLTPSRHRAPAWERDALARGTAFRVEAAGETLRAWRFGSGPTVLLVHGWGGRAGQLAPLFVPLEEAGLSVVAFDAPAHGDSSGRLSSAPVFAAAVAEVAQRVRARAVVAHSLGAAGLGLALSRGLPADAAVLIAPPRSPAPFFRAFTEALTLRPRIASAARARLEHRFGTSLEQLDVARPRARTTAAMLVVHDRDDREVPWSDGAAIADAFAGARLVTTTGLGHRRILRDPGVVRDVVRFVAEHVAASVIAQTTNSADGTEPRAVGASW